MLLISSTTRALRPSGRRAQRRSVRPDPSTRPFTFHSRIVPTSASISNKNKWQRWGTWRGIRCGRVEYLRPEGLKTKVVTTPERDPKSNTVVRASGLIAFDGGEVSTFAIGYTAGTVIMDLQLVGSSGVIDMDDFVMDWANSFVFKNPDIEIGYFHRTGMATRREVSFIPTPTKTAQELTMIETFTELAASSNVAGRIEYATFALKTQEYLDALWKAANS